MADFVPPTEEIIQEVVNGLRPADRREVWLSSHSSPDRAVRSSVDASRGACAAIVSREGVICLFGVGHTLLSRHGSPWMLGTGLVDRYRRVVAAYSRPVVNRMRRRWAALENFVHADNLVSVRWLGSCGFTIDPAAPFGPEGAMFHRFWTREEANV